MLSMSTHVLIVDSHEAVCTGVQHYLKTHITDIVVGQLSSCQDIYAYLDRHAVDIIILDVKFASNLYVLSGVEWMKRARKKGIMIPMIIYSGYDFPQYRIAAYKAGANAFCSKKEPLSHLVQILEIVKRGIVIKEQLTTEGNELTKQEIDILNLLAKGKKNREIAQMKHISTRTVEYHITSLFTKLNVENRIQAVLKGLIRGYVFEEDLVSIK